MTVLFSLLTLLELSVLLAYDIRLSKGDRSRRLAIRLASSVGGIVLIASDLVLASRFGVSELVIDISFVTAMLIMFPCSFEKPDTSLKVSLGLLLFDLLTMLYFLWKPYGTYGFKSLRIVCSFVPMLVFVLFYYLRTAYRRFTGIRAMFRNAAVWHNVEEYSRFLYSIAFLATGMLFLCSAMSAGRLKGVLTVISLMMYLTLYAVLYLRAITGRTFVLSVAAENRIKEIIKGNLRTSYVEKAEEDRKMNNLYRRVVMYMEEKKPYLDHTFDMADLADLMLTNKLYLSKTINILSGRNFRQFVNYYRIQRAIELFKTDPRLKVCEVSEMSGFHTAVSFNMLFKVNTGKTPTEWLNTYMSETERKKE